MDSFLAAANDLDRVLDEFEQNEDSVEPSAYQPNWKAIPSHLQGPDTQLNMSGPRKPDFSLAPAPPQTNGLSLEDVQQGDLTNGSMDGDQRSQSDAASSSGSELLIDLSEADFAPSAKPSPLLVALQDSLAAQKDSEQLQEPPVSDHGLPSTNTDSNLQLNQGDFTSFLSTNSSGSMSINTLQEAGSPLRPKQQNGLSTVTADWSVSQEQPMQQQQQHRLENTGLDSQFDQSMSTRTVEGQADSQSISSVDTSDSFSQPQTQGIMGSGDHKHEQVHNEESLTHTDSSTTTPHIDGIESTTVGTNNGMKKSPEQTVQDVSSQGTKRDIPEKSSPSNSSLSSNTPPVDSEIMQEYMRQGARPKLIGYRTPEQSPLKNTLDKESPKTDNVKVSESAPVIGFSTLKNVTVSQSELDELDDLESKPLAYDVSGDGVSHKGPVPQHVGSLENNVPAPSMDGQTHSVTEQGNSGTLNQHSSTHIETLSGGGIAPVSSDMGMPRSVIAPPLTDVQTPGTRIVPQDSSVKPQGLLSIPADNADDRISPVSKLLDQQYRLDVYSSDSGNNELANMDPFYGGKPQLESSTEEDIAPDILPKNSDHLSSMQQGHKPEFTANANINSTSHTSPDRGTTVGSTLGFAITEDPEQESLGTLQPNVNAPVAGDYSSHQFPQQHIPVGTSSPPQVDSPQIPRDPGSTQTTLQDLAPVQRVSVPAAAPPQLSTAQPVVPGMSPEVGVEAGFEDSGQILPPDPPSYQQVEQSTTEERHNISRQGLTLDFSSTPDQLNGYPGGEHQEVMHGTDPSAYNQQVMTPPNVSLAPNYGMPGTQNGFMPPNVTIPVEGMHPQNGEPMVPEGLDPMTAQNNALNAQHMLPVQQGQQVGVGEEGVAVPGDVAPIWIPDSEAPACMGCGQKFTFRKRRHHCRACGKVFCSKCCNVKVRLRYMDSKEARVCTTCLNAILTAEALQRVMLQGGAASPANSPGASPAHQAVAQPMEDATMEENNALQRSKSVLRRPASQGSRSRETRNVHFSDGTAPGMELGEPADGTQSAPPPAPIGDAPPPTAGDPQSQPLPASIRGIPELQGGNRRRLQRQGWHKSLIPEDETRLPPVIMTTEVKGEFSVDDNPNMEKILADLRSDNPVPVVFVLSKNLMVLVQIVELNCCVNRTCWCFSSKGLATMGQDEVVIVLECLPDDKIIPRDLFCHLYSLYEDAKRGNTVTDMSHSLFSGGGFLGSRDHGGFLYVRPSFQCLQKLILPEPPYLFAILLQKWETPWAKVFPLRLLLRLGAEFRYYPCPLMSVRFRKPVFGEIGHTIMNLLADFKNYQYKLPVIRGVVIQMEDRQTVISFPRNRYDELMKVLNNSNEHVMALAAVFSPDADSHLVCLQNDQGAYQTQAINIQNKPRKVTGASFVVFNGALKSSSGLTAKSSIVEDGLMVQIRPETMSTLKESMRNMTDVTIPCGSSEAETAEETVLVKWVEDDKNFNTGVTSPIDGRSLAGVESVRIHSNREYQGGAGGHSRAVRWTEVFFLQNGLGEGESLGHPNVPEPVDLSRLAESLAAAFCLALSGSLSELREAGLVKLGLRATVDVERVGYEAGSKGQLLPPHYMNSLDNELIPVVHGAASQHEGAPVILELIFHIVD